MNLSTDSIEVNKILNNENLNLVLNKNNSINEYFRKAIDFGLENNLFELFDNYLLNSLKVNNINRNALLARILSLCSQFNDLCLKSEFKSNENKKCDKNNENISLISNTIECFESYDLEKGFQCLTQLRNYYGIGNQMTTNLYNSCVNTLIKNCVKTVFDFVSLKTNKSLTQISNNRWVVAKSAARIDLQGGWSDTPPICFEMGGRVVNIAIKVNDQKPIGAKARKVDIFGQTLIAIKEYDFNKQLLLDLKVNKIEDFYNFCDPNSDGCLVKSVLICCQIIDIKNDKSLYKQLENNLKSGLEIELWSDLPQGSGLGTSSILSSCLIAVLWTLLGKTFSKLSLINAVLYVEQLMTTGGGWQDQVGGIVGGIKLGRTENSLPLKVEYKSIEINDSFRTLFENQLMLIYSGTVRLAKNLLQNVIQNWYIRDQRITDCFEELLTNADICSEALIKEDLQTIGALLSRYWQQKKILAPNSEPKHVSEFFKRVEPLIFGGSLCGAGGGGFMVLLIRDLEEKSKIISLMKDFLPESQIYDCSIDYNGFEISIDGLEYEISNK